MPRKTTGCWTCRARKKKCDDGRPCCSSCTLRSITCYGYDAKPRWMDGGQLEKEIMCAIKLQIKESYRRRRSRVSQLHPTQGCRENTGNASTPPPSRDNQTPGPDPFSSWSREITISPSLSSRFINGHTRRTSDLRGTEHRHGSYSPMNDTVEPSGIDNTDSYGSQSNSDYSLSFSPRNGFGTRCSYDERELNLVMYYLDHIFPRLCPYFKYSASDNGRGWLLNLFLRTRPLCTAAVCLSACDQAQFVLGPLSDIPQPYHELEMQHIRSVMDLRDHLDQLSKKTGASQMAASVEALACIMHLILFELWIPRKGLMNDWVMHLDAASALLSSVDVPSIVFGSSPISNSSEASCQLEHGAACDIPIELLSDGEKSAFEFFLTLYTYVFITSAATLGLTPQSAQSIPRTRALYHKDQSKLKDMLGCEDWVMLTILDIAVLKDWKQKMKISGTLSLRELTRQADLIEDRLNDWLATLASTKSSIKSFREEQQRMVTDMYISAALVFLHVVVSGFYPDLPEIQQSVLQTLRALEYIREHSAINFPSWPFCVAGCLALESEYPRFRALVPPPKKGEHPLVMSKWTLEILEECWSIRKSQSEGEETCSWVTAMNHLGTRLLLL